MNIYKFKLRTFSLNNRDMGEANEKNLSKKCAISCNHHVRK